MAMGYEEAARALFQVPHGQFVDERKRLAAELKAAGDKLAASRISRHQRPPVTAWAVNQLYWHARDAVDALFALADRLRSGDLSATAAHRDALAKLRGRAAAMLGDAGHGANEATLRRIALTLSSVAAAGTWMPDAPGQLSADRDPPGFDAVGVINPPSAPLPPPPEPVKYDFSSAEPIAVLAPPPKRNAVDELAARRRQIEEEAPPEAGEIVDDEADTDDTDEAEDFNSAASTPPPSPAPQKRSALDELAARRKQQRDEAEEERRRKFMEDGGTRDKVIAKRMLEAKDNGASETKRERVESAVSAKLDTQRLAEPPAPPAMSPPQASDLIARVTEKLAGPERPKPQAPKPAPVSDAERRKIDARAKLKAELEARLRTANAEVLAAEQHVEKLTAELADADDAVERAREIVEDLRDKLDALD